MKFFEGLGLPVLIALVCLLVGYLRGVESTETRYKAEASVQLQQTVLANSLLHRHIQRVDAENTKELLDVQENLDRALDGIGNGSERLLVRTVRTKCSVSKASNATSLGDGASRAELHADDSAEILKLAARADKVAIQLRACQQSLFRNYQVINSPSGVEMEK